MWQSSHVPRNSIHQFRYPAFNFPSSKQERHFGRRDDISASVKATFSPNICICNLFVIHFVCDSQECRGISEMTLRSEPETPCIISRAVRRIKWAKSLTPACRSTELTVVDSIIEANREMRINISALDSGKDGLWRVSRSLCRCETWRRQEMRHWERNKTSHRATLP